MTQAPMSIEVLGWVAAGLTLATLHLLLVPVNLKRQLELYAARPPARWRWVPRGRAAARRWSVRRGTAPQQMAPDASVSQATARGTGAPAVQPREASPSNRSAVGGAVAAIKEERPAARPALRAVGCALACTLPILLTLPTRPAVAATAADQIFAGALQSLRSGRVPEAYGRFIRLAEAGHASAAHYAIYMCLHGPDAFGKDFDCSPQELEDWASAAGVPVPPLAMRRFAPLVEIRRSGSR